METQQQAYDQVHEKCGLLLFLSGNTENPELIGKQAARALLRNIVSHASGQSGAVSQLILQRDVEKAGLDVSRWEKAVEGGLLIKHENRTGVSYELPNVVRVEEHTVPATLIAQLEYISGAVKAVSARGTHKR